MFGKKNTLSLIKSRKIFRNCYRSYKRKKHLLSKDKQNTLKDLLSTLHNALQDKDKNKASDIAKETLSFVETHLPKTRLEKTLNFFGQLFFALFLAILIRQMWFEFYMIPSGSMRPTLKESDLLVVSKTAYSIDTPWRTGHFYFDNSLIKRGEIVVFSGDGMDIQDVDTMYFYLIPGKKQFIKRLVGKPGDILYFYGGQIYGIDKEGKIIDEFQKDPWFMQMEHIPFIKFEGKTITPPYPQNGIFSPVYLYQMNDLVAKIEYNQPSYLQGKIASDPQKNPLLNSASQIKELYDFWGMKNYAMVRILTKKQLQDIYEKQPENDALLYLEMTHHPSILHPKLIKDIYGRLRPAPSYEVSFLPIYQRHVDKLFAHLYTCRFKVKEEKAFSISTPKSHLRYKEQFPTLKNVPNGTYEIQNGIAYQVYPLGITKKLPTSHPLYDKSPERLQTLFNLGTELNNFFQPTSTAKDLLPPRYGYFRDSSLYLLGSNIYNKNDPILTHYLQEETSGKGIPFIDIGSPILPDGSFSTAIIKKYGLKVPEKSYLVLGDNHAMSADSREFGFVPQKNLRGKASFIFWPISPRMGKLPQAISSMVSLPNITVIALVILCIFSYIYYHKKKKYPL